MKTYTILIADDFPDNLQVIVDALKGISIPHKIIRAINGKILCDLALKRLPDLIITDWEMPEMDGIEAIKYLKSVDSTKDIPIIMCTGIMTTSQNLKMALDSGAVDFIRKPIDPIELEARVNSMLKLSDSYLTIKEQNIVLESQKLEIVSQKNELEITNSTKDRFFGIIAHDLRSPFNGFLGLTQMMSDQLENFSMEDIQIMTAGLRKSADNLYRLLENLLNWAKMQQGIFTIEKKQLKLQPIVDDCIQIVLESVMNKGIEISSKVPDNLMVYADPDVLQTVFRNLLSNAVKFSNRNGIVRLSAKLNADNEVEVSIEDKGIGMNAHFAENIFRIDIQTNRKGTDGEPSTGLGLIVCKDFIEKQGGKIWFVSQENVGSTFTFTIPSAPTT